MASCLRGQPIYATVERSLNSTLKCLCRIDNRIPQYHATYRCPDSGNHREEENPQPVFNDAMNVLQLAMTCPKTEELSHPAQVRNVTYVRKRPTGFKAALVPSIRRARMQFQRCIFGRRCREPVLCNRRSIRRNTRGEESCGVTCVAASPAPARRCRGRCARLYWAFHRGSRLEN